MHENYGNYSEYQNIVQKCSKYLPELLSWVKASSRYYDNDIVFIKLNHKLQTYITSKKKPWWLTIGQCNHPTFPPYKYIAISKSTAQYTYSGWMIRFPTPRSNQTFAETFFRLKSPTGKHFPRCFNDFRMATISLFSYISLVFIIYRCLFIFLYMIVFFYIYLSAYNDVTRKLDWILNVDEMQSSSRNARFEHKFHTLTPEVNK